MLSDIYNIRPVTSKEECITIESLARIILHEVYDAYIPPDHTDFFLSKYQTAEQIQRQIRRKAEYYMISCAGKDVGYLGIQPKETILLLDKLYLLPEHRGQAAGKQAMDLAEERARNLRLSVIELIVNRKNLRAISFYERHGYQISEELEYASPLGYTIYGYKMNKTILL